MLGHRGYDNWLVQHALKSNISVLDATETIHALHQTGSDGNYAGHHHVHADYNIKILPPFSAALGI